MPRAKRIKRLYGWELDDPGSGVPVEGIFYESPNIVVAGLRSVYGDGLKLVYYHSSSRKIVAYRRPEPPKQQFYRARLRDQAKERRDVVVLMHKSGSSFQEIGEVLGVTRQRAWTIWKKAKQLNEV